MNSRVYAIKDLEYIHTSTQLYMVTWQHEKQMQAVFFNQWGDNLVALLRTMTQCGVSCTISYKSVFEILSEYKEA